MIVFFGCFSIDVFCLLSNFNNKFASSFPRLANDEFDDSELSSMPSMLSGTSGKISVVVFGVRSTFGFRIPSIGFGNSSVSVGRAEFLILQEVGVVTVERRSWACSCACWRRWAKSPVFFAFPRRSFRNVISRLNCSSRKSTSFLNFKRLVSDSFCKCSASSTRQ